MENSSSPCSEEGFSFQKTLNLYNVDQYAIGYYACSDYFVHENIVNNITEEPENTEHVSYIYVYVNGEDILNTRHNRFIIIIGYLLIINHRFRYW